MSKKDFIALADAMRPIYNQGNLSDEAIAGLIRFCKGQNNAFMQGRWLNYLKGECGPSGGTIKQKKA